MELLSQIRSLVLTTRLCLFGVKLTFGVIQACVYARFLCEQAGVKFVLGEPQGKLATLIVTNSGLKKKVTGIKTCDGRSHFGDLVIVACKKTSIQFLWAINIDTYSYLTAGCWTAGIIPEAHNTVEATAGTVVFIDIPRNRQDLWKRFHPDNYPVWSYRKGEGDK